MKWILYRDYSISVINWRGEWRATVWESAVEDDYICQLTRPTKAGAAQAAQNYIDEVLDE